MYTVFTPCSRPGIARGKIDIAVFLPYSNLNFPLVSMVSLRFAKGPHRIHFQQLLGTCTVLSCPVISAENNVAENARWCLLQSESDGEVVRPAPTASTWRAREKDYIYAHPLIAESRWEFSLPIAWWHHPFRSTINSSRNSICGQQKPLLSAWFVRPEPVEGGREAR